MVVKIQKSHPAMKGTLEYNLRKVEKGVAVTLGTFNIPDTGSQRDIQNTFESYEHRNIMSEKVSFQMSINPNPDKEDERLTDDEALRYARELLEGMGYGNQPAVVFRHSDINRVHYHVVSIRTDANGKKIRDYQENMRLQRLAARLGRDYHYELGDGEQKKDRKKGRTLPRPRFDPKAADVTGQYASLAEAALEWRFETTAQFACIMRSMGVDVEFTEGTDEDGNMKRGIMLQGMDYRNRKSNAAIPQEALGDDYYARVAARMAECAAMKPDDEERKKDLARRKYLFKVVSGLLEKSETQGHFERMLRKAGIEVMLSRNIDGEVFGATFADMREHRAYKCSELSRATLLAAIKEAAVPETGRWDVNETALREEWLERRRAERREAHIQMNMDLAAEQDSPTVRTGRNTGAASVRKERTPDAFEVFEDIILGTAGLLEAILGRQGNPTGQGRAVRGPQPARRPRRPRYR